MKKTIFSLALGTFGLGMAEFGIMGVLPDMARDVGISIPAAGNMIAWYAFGVVIGAPIMALLSSRFSLKSVMLFLAALCILGNTLFTFSSSYAMLALGRLVSGFPHGAFFGVGAIILSKIAPPGKVTAAVAGMIGGMTIANLVGVPAAPGLGITLAGAIPSRLSRCLTSRCFWPSAAGCPRCMTGPARGCASSSVFWLPRRRG
ncbi:MFS transport protein AraJ [Klebsiella quasipneumoniae]|nr:MFS transport protein AraJ [Klebsiella quasipneumoniae]